MSMMSPFGELVIDAFATRLLAAARRGLSASVSSMAQGSSRW
jgi:hypothetical protein